MMDAGDVRGATASLDDIWQFQERECPRYRRADLEAC